MKVRNPKRLAELLRLAQRTRLDNISPEFMELYLLCSVARVKTRSGIRTIYGCDGNMAMFIAYEQYRFTTDTDEAHMRTRLTNACSLICSYGHCTGNRGDCPSCHLFGVYESARKNLTPGKEVKVDPKFEYYAKKVDGVLKNGKRIRGGVIRFEG